MKIKSFRKEVTDHWMRPRTRAGLDEMRRRLKAMRELLKSASSSSIESEIAYKVFNEYFSFEWDEKCMQFQGPNPYKDEEETSGPIIDALKSS
jgi:hypothetical protein